MTADTPAGALAQRLAALLCLTGAGVFGCLAAAISRLDRIPGSLLYRLPGGASLDPAALIVVAACAGLFALCGFGLLLLAPPRRTMPKARPKQRRPALVLILGVAALLAALMARRFGF